MELLPMLAKRLKAIKNLVPAGAVVADIGTDHAYIPISLIGEGIVQRAIACDVSEGSLQKALKNVKAYQMSDKILCRRGDGLDVVCKSEADCIIIAGMGGLLISQIIDKAYNKLQDELLILQPMTAVVELREYLCSHGFWIQDEELVLEEGIYYHIIATQKGRPEDAYDCVVGSRLVEKKHPLLHDYLAHRVTYLNTLIPQMQKSDRACQKAADYQRMIAHYQTILEAMEDVHCQ